MNQYSTIEEIIGGAGSDLPAAAFFDEPEPQDFQLCTRMVLDEWDYYIPGEAYRMGKRAGHVFLWVNDQVAALDADALKLRYVLSAEWQTLPRPVQFRERTATEQAEARRAEYLTFVENIVEGDDRTQEIAHRADLDGLTYAAAEQWLTDTEQMLYPEPGSFEYTSAAELTLSDAL